MTVFRRTAAVALAATATISGLAMTAQPEAHATASIDTGTYRIHTAPGVNTPVIGVLVHPDCDNIWGAQRRDFKPVHKDGYIWVPVHSDQGINGWAINPGDKPYCM